MKLAVITAVGVVLLLLLSFIPIATDSSIRCKDDERGVLFSYDSFFHTVAIDGYPTFKSGDSWVDFIDVADEQFIIVFSQDTYDPKRDTIRPKQHVYHYRGGDGITFWYDVPPEDTLRIKNQGTLPPQQPTDVFTNCSNQPGGTLVQLFMASVRA